MDTFIFFLFFDRLNEMKLIGILLFAFNFSVSSFYY